MTVDLDTLTTPFQPFGVQPVIANNSGRGKGELPDGVGGWSWGAFFFGALWAISNRTWIGLLSLVPGIGFLMAFVLGVKGREWAWRNKYWESVEHFNKVQRYWSVVAVCLILSGLVTVGLATYFL